MVDKTDPVRRYVDPEWECLSREALVERRWRLVRERLHELQVTNTFYRRLWEKNKVDLDDLRSPTDFLHRLPTVTKSDLLDDQANDPPFGTVLGVDPRELAEVHLTSGTSGFGQGVFGLTARDLENSAAGYVHLWTYAGLMPGDIGILTYPVSFLTGGLLGVAASRRYRLIPFYAAGLHKRHILDLISRFRVATLFATPGVLRDLQLEAEECGFDPRDDANGLKAICTGLVMPPYEQIERIRQFWDAPVYENYGLTEAANAVAVSCEESVWNGERKHPLHLLEHLFYVEIIDPRTGSLAGPGEDGELVLTTFRRQASPVIRYRTGDRVISIPHSSCPCGRPFDGIESGEIRRYDDMLKLKGLSVWPQSIEKLLFSRPEVDEYRATVGLDERGKDVLEIRIAFSPRIQLNAPDRARVLDELARDIKLTTNITPRLVEVPALEHFSFKAKRWVDERGSQSTEALGAQ